MTKFFKNSHPAIKINLKKGTKFKKGPFCVKRAVLTNLNFCVGY